VIGLIYTLLNAKSGPRLILENKLIIHIGKVSFSIYLLHMPLYHLTMPTLESHLHPAPAFIAFIIIIIAASTVAYKTIENPFMKVGDTLFRKSLKRQYPNTE
jgi:peptidoglycan/LPS O-acetylase OafA/YrhL